MEYYITIEPAFAGTHWCNQCIQGINHNASRYNGNLVEVSIDDTNQLKKIAETKRPIMIVVGSLLNWMTETVHTLSSYGIHSIMLASSPTVSLLNASSITMDYTKVLYDLGQYLLSLDHSRIALLGVHPNSMNDLTKMRAFAEFAKDKLNRLIDNDIYWNYGLLEECCNNFYKNIDQYDSVICSNDIVAIKLLNYLKERNIQIPQRLYLIGLGETILSNMVRPSITTASLDFYDIGENAVMISNILTRNLSITSLQAQVHGIITVRESTDNKINNSTEYISSRMELPQQSDFYADTDVNEIFQLENLISHCNQLDFSILKGLLTGQKYPKLAEDLYTTENTIKYRIKRMKTLADKYSRTQMVQLIERYLNPENLP